MAKSRKKEEYVDFTLTAEEYEELLFQPYEWRISYLMLRSKMNFKTGIVGEAAHPINEQAFKDVLYIDTGRNRQKDEVVTTVTRGKVRAIIAGLENKGLIKRRPDLGPFVFQLVYAKLDKSGQKIYDRNTTRNAAKNTTKKTTFKSLKEKENNKDIQPNIETAPNSLYNPPQDISNTKVLDINTNDHFEKFWEVYPRKEGKKKARESWAKQKLDSLADTIIADVIDRAARHAQWQNKQYIPHPATYLNNQRWTDEILEVNRYERSNASQSSGTKSAAQRATEFWDDVSGSIQGADQLAIDDSSIATD